LVVVGLFEHVGVDGFIHTTKFIADKNGYKAKYSQRRKSDENFHLQNVQSGEGFYEENFGDQNLSEAYGILPNNILNEIDLSENSNFGILIDELQS
jgi:hypothetical protein